MLAILAGQCQILRHELDRFVVELEPFQNLNVPEKEFAPPCPWGFVPPAGHGVGSRLVVANLPPW